MMIILPMICTHENWHDIRKSPFSIGITPLILCFHCHASFRGCKFVWFVVPDCAGDSEISQGYVSSTVWAVGTWVSSSGPLRVFLWCGGGCGFRRPNINIKSHHHHHHHHHHHGFLTTPAKKKGFNKALLRNNGGLSTHGMRHNNQC